MVIEKISRRWSDRLLEQTRQCSAVRVTADEAFVRGQELGGREQGAGARYQVVGGRW